MPDGYRPSPSVLEFAFRKIDVVPLASERRGFRGLPNLPKKSARYTWNVLVFPIKLHDDRDGVVLSARLIEKKGFTLA